MANWTGRVWDLDWVSGPWTGGGLWPGKVWGAGSYTDVGGAQLRAVAVALSPTTTKVWFGQSMDVISTTAGDYTITGPMSVTVSSIAASADYLTITHSGITTPGTYTVAVAANKVRSRVGGYRNLSALSLDYVAAYTPFDLQLEFFPTRVGPNVVRVFFAVPLGSNVNTDDETRYAITGPTSITVDSVDFTPGDQFVDLNVSGPWANGTYSLEIDADTAEAEHDDTITNDNDTVDWEVDSQNELTYTWAKRSWTSVRVFFSEPLADIPETEDDTRYTISGPSAITVVSASFTPSTDYVDLTVSGDWADGDYYLDVEAATAAKETDEEAVNLAGSELFIVVSPPLLFSAQKRSATVVRVDFNQALVSRTETSDDTRYTVTGPSTITVVSVSFTPGNTYVDLTVSGSWVNGTYTVTIDADTAEAESGERNV